MSRPACDQTLDPQVESDQPDGTDQPNESNRATGHVETVTEPEETLGQRVRSLRRKQKLSLNDLARLSGISKGYLSQVERSVAVRPSALTIFSIAEALGTTVGELFEGSEEAGAEPAADTELPDALREFAQEADLPPTDVNMLASISYRGAQPRDKDDWRFLYESIRRSIRAPGRSAAG